MTEQQDDRIRSADALRAMAEGEDLACDSPAEGENPDEQAERTDAENREDTDDSLTHESLGIGTDSLQVRRARSASMNRQSAGAHAHRFKTVMIPLLLVVAVILFVMGSITAMMASGGGDGLSDREFFVENGRYFTLAAFPLGAILLFGAWWFHRDVRGARRG